MKRKNGAAQVLGLFYLVGLDLDFVPITEIEVLIIRAFSYMIHPIQLLRGEEKWEQQQPALKRKRGAASIFVIFQIFGWDLDFAPVIKIGDLINTSVFIYDTPHSFASMRRKVRKKATDYTKKKKRSCFGFCHFSDFWLRSRVCSSYENRRSHQYGHFDI